MGSTSGVPFLSRHFGSARSFNHTASTSPLTSPSMGHPTPLPLPLQTIQPIASLSPGQGAATATTTAVPIFRSFGSGRRVLNGGPNAAYFGSLQRLMPYNLEYDFAVIQERGALDSLEQDASRMQQYWGVATTEL